MRYGIGKIRCREQMQRGIRDCNGKSGGNSGIEGKRDKRIASFGRLIAVAARCDDKILASLDGVGHRRRLSRYGEAMFPYFVARSRVEGPDIGAAWFECMGMQKASTRIARGGL